MTNWTYQWVIKTLGLVLWVWYWLETGNIFCFGTRVDKECLSETVLRYYYYLSKENILKVLYIGANRNKSWCEQKELCIITKQTYPRMSDVPWTNIYDHSEVMKIKNEQSGHDDKTKDDLQRYDLYQFKQAL